MSMFPVDIFRQIGCGPAGFISYNKSSKWLKFRKLFGHRITGG